MVGGLERCHLLLKLEKIIYVVNSVFLDSVCDRIFGLCFYVLPKFVRVALSYIGLFCGFVVVKV